MTIKNDEDVIALIQIGGRRNGKSASMKEYVEAKLNPKVFCKFCGRALKSEKSKEMGCGQGCFKRWVKGRSHKRSLI